MSNQEQEQVIVGRLVNPEQIETKGRRLVDFSEFQHRAMWSYLRLQFGRDIDTRIKQLYEEHKVKDKAHAAEVLAAFWRSKVTQYAEMYPTSKLREIQFIMSGQTVMAVASLKHLLIPAAQVYEATNKILISTGNQKQLLEESDVAGQVLYEKEVAGIKYGLQIYGGTLNTRFAIRIAAVIRVLSCLNVVSWLGIGGFRHWVTGAATHYDRVLRIEKITELEPRLKEAIIQARTGLSHMDEQLKASRKVHITERQARALAASMGFSYGLGAATVKQVLDRFAEEQQTLYGLAMAESWVARNGEFSALAQRADKSLSTVAGATMLIKNPKDAEKKSIAWLKAHIKKGQRESLDDIVGDLIQ